VLEAGAPPAGASISPNLCASFRLGVINVDPDDGTGIVVPRSQHGLSEAAGEQDRESRLLFEVVAGFDVLCYLTWDAVARPPRSTCMGATDPHDPPGRNHLALAVAAGTVILAL
jgi:hypothetical protein